jgi:hypothetical protein
MTAHALDRERLACRPMGDLEFVVERLRGGRTETWFVLRPHREFASEYRANGMSLSRGCRIVVEAKTLKPVGVLATDIPPPARPAAGYNPYFDVPPS